MVIGKTQNARRVALKTYSGTALSVCRRISALKFLIDLYESRWGAHTKSLRRSQPARRQSAKVLRTLYFQQSGISKFNLSPSTTSTLLNTIDGGLRVDISLLVSLVTNEKLREAGPDGQGYGIWKALSVRPITLSNLLSRRSTFLDLRPVLSQLKTKPEMTAGP